MALVKCPECGRENVSSTAEACPACGYNLKSHYGRTLGDNKEKRRKKLKIGCVLGIVILAILGVHYVSTRCNYAGCTEKKISGEKYCSYHSNQKTCTWDTEWNEPLSENERAVETAKSYLRHTAFSYEGLVDQLEYEGYSETEAEYGAKNCGADWDTQAVEKAKSYLKHTAFSYEGLKDQLEYEGFTEQQAEYGVEHCNANWKEQAVKKAKSYLKSFDYSRGRLIDQLECEGFTYEQASYGAKQAGL